MLASFPGSPTRGLKRKAGRGHTPSDGKLGGAVLQATKRWVGPYCKQRKGGWGHTASNEKVGGAWERGYVCVPVDKISGSLKPIIQRRQTFIFHFMKIKHYWCCLANAPNTSPLRNIFGWALTLCTRLSFFCPLYWDICDRISHDFFLQFCIVSLPSQRCPVSDHLTACRNIGGGKVWEISPHEWCQRLLSYIEGGRGSNDISRLFLGMCPSTRDPNVYEAENMVSSHDINCRGKLISGELMSWELISCELMSWELISCELMLWELISCELILYELISWKSILWELISWELISWTWIRTAHWMQ